VNDGRFCPTESKLPSQVLQDLRGLGIEEPLFLGGVQSECGADDLVKSQSRQSHCKDDRFRQKTRLSRAFAPLGC